MAIIKCPECGRQVSDKAPSCPNCGVEISGKLVRCSDCGEIYFISDRLCPACHHLNSRAPKQQMPLASQTAPVTQAPQQQTASHSQQKPNNATSAEEEKPKKKSNGGALIISIIFAAIICGGMFYLYLNAQGTKEKSEYELAIKSEDPLVLETYLKKFPNEDADHVQAIKERLAQLQSSEVDWDNAVKASSRSAYQQYLDKYPDSPHRAEALNKIDEIDWETAVKSTADIKGAMEAYLQQHHDGAHASEAQSKINQITEVEKSITVQPDEQLLITNLYRTFFQAVNARDEAKLRSAVTLDGSHADMAVKYMNSQYKPEIKNFNFRIDNDSYNISKDVSHDGLSKTFKVSFNVTKRVATIDGQETEESRTVTSTVGPDGKIVSLSIK